MGIRERPEWIEYSQQTTHPSLIGFIRWTNKKYAGEQSQEIQHENVIVVGQ